MLEGQLFGKAVAKPASDKPSDNYTTRELWRFIKFYTENIRMHPAAETKGVIRQIQNLLNKGISFDDIAIALENYRDDPWRKTQDQRYSRPIRTFFTAESIREWQTPKPPIKAPTPVVPAANFTTTTKPVPVQPVILEGSDDDGF